MTPEKIEQMKAELITGLRWQAENAAGVTLDARELLDLLSYIAALEARVKAARDALEWYAVEVADCRKISSDGNVARAKLDRDGGHRARTALTNTPRSDAATEE